MSFLRVFLIVIIITTIKIITTIIIIITTIIIKTITIKHYLYTAALLNDPALITKLARLTACVIYALIFCPLIR